MQRNIRIGQIVALWALVLVNWACAQQQQPQTQPSAADAGVRVIPNVAYREGELSDYEKERCKLDLYLPEKARNFATIVWFHGGGLTEGDKRGTAAMAKRFARDGIAVAAANYRLSPKVKYPAYVEDAAAAVAWTMRHIAEQGGDPKKVFVSGHSAGGYLTAAIGFDPRFLQAHGIKTEAIAGLIPVSPQVFTHYTIRQERGIVDYKTRAIIDEAAPTYHARKDAPPVLIFVADKDMATRPEENAYFVAMLKNLKHPDATLMVIPDRTHGSVGGKMKDPDDPAYKATVDFITRLSAGTAATR